MSTEKNGWIKLYRQTLDNPIIMKDADHLAVWVYLLLNATHAEYPALFKGKRITLQPGQLITGRKSIADKLVINESKITRVLDAFENEHQIEQQTSNKNRLISIVNWDLYQSIEQQDEQQMNNNRTTSEQQVNTNKNVKNNKNEKNVKSKKEKSFDLFQRLLPDYKISNTVQSKMCEWFVYKDERNEKYTETGMKTLLGRIEKKSCEFGDEAICDLIDESISNDWKGIIFDRLKKPQGRKEIVPKWALKNQHDYDFDEIEKDLLGETKTAGNDPDVQARAEELKRKLGGV